jgi:predicted acetyltransferase
MKITKAIIPVAGWGTRRLPVTKTIEKCMGECENTTERDGVFYRRYWINIEKIRKIKK